jgi:hypothetical protein
MSYKYAEVCGIRKMKWDALWHILYTVKGKLTYDRVSKKEALSIKVGKDE